MFTTNRIRRSVSILGGVLATLFACSLTFGQLTDLDLKKPLGDQLPIGGQPGPPGLPVALEGPVDPSTYILGPGDNLEFKVWGNIEFQKAVVIGPDGKASIPTIGVIPMAGITVDNARQLLFAKAKLIYPRSNLSLRLTRVRMMKASISGAVEFPGVYDVSAVDRLSTLIQLAGGFAKPEPLLSQEEEDEFHKLLKERAKPSSEESEKKYEIEYSKPSLRRIEIARTDTSAAGKRRLMRVDYQHYERSGDLDYNPVLRDGDAVRVPMMDREVGTLRIFGAVREPGVFEYIPGDRLLDLVELAGGFRSNALLNAIEIERFKTGAGPKAEISVDVTAGMEAGAGYRGPELFVDDRVFVREIPEYHLKYHVTVKGEVLYPGEYPIVQDTTTLTDIIEACGGFTERANLQRASVIRKSVAEIEDLEFKRLQNIPIAEMADLEREYFKTRSREDAPKVVVEFEKLFQEAELSQDITLKDQDEIIVPTLTPTVNVTGQVTHPGLIRWKPGMNAEYYIKKAGGFAWNARKGKMRLIKAKTGIWIKPKKMTFVEIGDTIFVPEKRETDNWDLLKDILLVATQIATILLVIQNTVR